MEHIRLGRAGLKVSRICLGCMSHDTCGRTLYDRTEDADRRVVEAVAHVAAQRGVRRAQVALAWLLAQAGITAPIVGATQLAHLDDAIAAPYVPHAVAGHA